MIIKNASLSDLDQIAECHISAFPKSLSSALGKRYVSKMLSWYLASEDVFLFFLEADQKVVGYCGGMIKRPNALTGSASGMAQHSFNEAIKAILLRPWLLFHPELFAKYKFIAKNLRVRLSRLLVPSGASVHQQARNFVDPYVALVVIGVRLNFQGKGYASILLEEFEQRARSKGYKKMLLTVRSENVQAIRSYLKNGWIETENKLGSTTMMKEL